VAGFNRPVSTDYRFAPALLVRLLGALIAGLGVLLVVGVMLVVTLDLPVAVLTSLVVLAVVVVAAGGLVVSRRARLVHFDEDGYQVRLLRGAGVRRARWREVEDAVTATVSGHDCVVLRLRDGRTTTIPVGVLDTDPLSFMTDLRSRLDAGHGYRRLS
jgi:hypothetical protein